MANVAEASREDPWVYSL